MARPTALLAAGIGESIFKGLGISIAKVQNRRIRTLADCSLECIWLNKKRKVAVGRICTATFHSDGSCYCAWDAGVLDFSFSNDKFKTCIFDGGK